MDISYASNLDTLADGSYLIEVDRLLRPGGVSNHIGSPCEMEEAGEGMG